jgi:hypothetical protein
MRSLGLGILIGGIAVVMIAAAAQGPVGWEYKVVTESFAIDAGHPSYKEIRTTEFNSYNKDGWEVVYAQNIPSQRVGPTGNDETIRVRETVLRKAQR